MDKPIPDNVLNNKVNKEAISITLSRAALQKVDRMMAFSKKSSRSGVINSLLESIQLTSMKFTPEHSVPDRWEFKTNTEDF